MIKAHVKLKAWGNSIGVIIPKDTLVHENLEAEDEVIITVKKKHPTVEDAFGMLKNFKITSKKSTDELLKEIDDELDSRLG
ncbi:MAG TPA: hypothetical protein VJH88_04495 [Candidatus Nanoarchaeia archaeon]|nr:hypothetical protein [Candidatus Nanoarchaeia archaeon]